MITSYVVQKHAEKVTIREGENDVVSITEDKTTPVPTLVVVYKEKTISYIGFPFEVHLTK